MFLLLSYEKNGIKKVMFLWIERKKKCSYQHNVKNKNKKKQQQQQHE